MSRSTAMIELGSSSVSLIGTRKDSLTDDHFRWHSIKKFVYLASTFSSSANNFDIFSKVENNVRITDFVLLEATVGIGYMCMDGFIKQYTKRFDCNKYLNPLLRGISYGRFMQTALLTVLAHFLSDSLRFLINSVREIPPWSVCQAKIANASCITQKEIYLRCRANLSTDFFTSSAYVNYMDTFRVVDRNTLTTCFFILGLVWLLVFFVASVSEETVVKIFKLTFAFTLLSTVVTLLFLFISTETNVTKKAFSEIVDISTESNFKHCFRHVSNLFGVGFLGLYDFGAISPFTMIDTAVVIYAVIVTLISFLRSMIVRMLYLVLSSCVTIDGKINLHVLFFGVLPLSTDFIYAHKMYVFYLYGNLMIRALVHMTILILIQAKFLSYEFRSVKTIYIVGLLCVVGITLSIMVLAIIMYNDGKHSFYGLDALSPFLAGVYVAIVMWLYGLKKFCVDVQFWLGFRPTRFWTCVWSILPVCLFAFTIQSVYTISKSKNIGTVKLTLGYVAIVLGLVLIMHVKALAGFLIQNNLGGLFKANKSYGPPDAEDRKRRLYYSEYTRQRSCKHHCLIIDDWFDCDHEVALPKKHEGDSSSSEISLMNLYDDRTTRLRSVGAESTHTAITAP